ncbi:MAG: ABC transporter substrate-binding protein [Patescibacteria group bacterium]
MDKNKKIWGGVAIIVIILGLAWYFQTNKTVPATGEPIKIGVVYGLTGSASAWTDYGKKALEMAAEEINEDGGIKGRPLELVFEDSETNPAKSVSAFQKLVTIDKVQVVIGDVWSFITNPLIPLADQNKIVLISPTVMNRAVEGASPYFFTVGHTVEGQRPAVEKFFNINPDIKTASILCWNDAWGKAHSQLFRQVATEKGIKILSEECTADFISTYRTELLKIKATDADALLVTSSSPVALFKAYTDLGLRQKVLATTIVVDGIEAQGMPREYVKNVWFMDWRPNEEFARKFEDKYGVYPILEAQNHYEALRSIAKGLENNPDNLLEGIMKVKYNSADGQLDFTAGDNTTVNKAEAKLYTVNPDEGYTEVK